MAGPTRSRFLKSVGELTYKVGAKAVGHEAQHTPASGHACAAAQHYCCPAAAAAAAGSSAPPPGCAAAAFCLAAFGSTVKDSPQPQVPLALGLMKTNSDLCGAVGGERGGVAPGALLQGRAPARHQGANRASGAQSSTCDEGTGAAQEGSYRELAQGRGKVSIPATGTGAQLACNSTRPSVPQHPGRRRCAC